LSACVFPVAPMAVIAWVVAWWFKLGRFAPGLRHVCGNNQLLTGPCLDCDRTVGYRYFDDKQQGEWWIKANVATKADVDGLADQSDLQKLNAKVDAAIARHDASR
jgi:hypothetical protein